MSAYCPRARLARPSLPPTHPTHPLSPRSAGEKNHRSFVGFLASLLVMCGWMVWGCVRYMQAACGAAPAGWASCSAWVAWVGANALFHLFWVAVLTGCQLYLLLCLGMTTNEQLNRARYRHFQARGGRSPFSRGPLNNAADFFQCSLCGLLAPRRQDWADPDADERPLVPDHAV